MPRTDLDDRIRQVAGSRRRCDAPLGVKAVGVKHDSSGRVDAVLLADGNQVNCRTLIVADGARSTLGRQLGRKYQETVRGGGHADPATPRSAPWISSDLELRSETDRCRPATAGSSLSGNGEG